jgi:phage terminase large subunit GpA-like protein
MGPQLIGGKENKGKKKEIKNKERKNHNPFDAKVFANVLVIGSNRQRMKNNKKTLPPTESP